MAALISHLCCILEHAREFVPDDVEGSGEFSKEDVDIALKWADEYFNDKD